MNKIYAMLITLTLLAGNIGLFYGTPDGRKYSSLVHDKSERVTQPGPKRPICITERPSYYP